MSETQEMLVIEGHLLQQKIKELYDTGYRLVQIGCTKLDVFEITYSFDKNYQFIYLKLILPLTNDGIPSISSIYWNAFLYENEMHDLFGISVKDIAIDYKGNFYRMTVKAPFTTLQPESTTKPTTNEQ
jgi:ech hydrogenase subunit D